MFRKFVYLCGIHIISTRMADKKSLFSAFRLKKDSVKLLQDMKEAFAYSYGHEMTNDEFIEHLVASVEGGEPGVWEIYCKQQMNNKELEELAARLRGESDK